MLEDEGERLGARVVGHARERPVVDAVEREDLLDVVAELVHRHVVPLVVHAALGDPGPQMGLVLPPQRLDGVAGAARRIDGDALGEPPRPLRREAQPLQEVGQAGREGREVGIALPGGPVELRLRDSPPAT